MFEFILYQTHQKENLLINLQRSKQQSPQNKPVTSPIHHQTAIPSHPCLPKKRYNSIPPLLPSFLGPPYAQNFVFSIIHNSLVCAQHLVLDSKE